VRATPERAFFAVTCRCFWRSPRNEAQAREPSIAASRGGKRPLAPVAVFSRRHPGSLPLQGLDPEKGWKLSAPTASARIIAGSVRITREPAPYTGYLPRGVPKGKRGAGHPISSTMLPTTSPRSLSSCAKAISPNGKRRPTVWMSRLLWRSALSSAREASRSAALRS
jgi:hypothetical protein